jgi:hypothetical protein
MNMESVRLGQVGARFHPSSTLTVRASFQDKRFLGSLTLFFYMQKYATGKGDREITGKIQDVYPNLT